MVSRRRRTVVALVLALAAALTLPVVQAGLAEAAGTPQLSITPSTGVKDGQQVAVTLTGAGDYDGMYVGFAECMANDADYSSGGCTTINPDTVISGGNASGTVTALVGPMPNNPGLSCTVANNGSCAIRAFVFMNGGTNMVAKTPISFADSSATITASPSTNLHDGDTVSVNVTGIPRTAGSRIDIAECNTDAAADQGSYFTGACKSLDMGTAAGGSYAKSVKIFDGFITTSVTCNETTPSGHCVLAALDHDNQKLLATTPITFVPQTLSISVTPSTGLHDGQQVSVTASGIPSGESSLYVLECSTTYAAAHGYDNLDACQRDSEVPVVDHALSTTLTIVDGTLNPGQDSSPSCTYSNNGNCAIVLVSLHFDRASPYAAVGTPTPISFRPPVTGPPTIAVTPTTGLYPGAPIDVTVDSAIPDDVDSVVIMECSTAGVVKHGYSGACASLTPDISVQDNTIPLQHLAAFEGSISGGDETQSPCDFKNACTLALFTSFLGGNDPAPLSNFVDLGFRDPNIGKPVIKVGRRSGLKAGQKVKVSLDKIPDMVRYVYLLECNLSVPKKSWQDGQPPCVSVSGINGVMIHDNAATTTAKMKPGLVGYQDTKHGTKKVFCNASTNGQCSIAVYMPRNFYGKAPGIIAHSATLSFT